jgi:glycosyltransferase involved in cell wall biosynthesis
MTAVPAAREGLPVTTGGQTTRPRVLVLTVGFSVGGAEQLILMTAPRLKREGFEVTVACLKGWGLLGDELEARGVRAVALGAKGVWDVRAAGRLLSILRRDRIQILRADLFLANQAARILGRLAGVPVVITTHHDTDVPMRFHRRLLERLTAPLSDAVVACSEAVRRFAIESYGLRPGLVRTVPNAIEIPEVAHDPQRRDRVRRELGATRDDLLVGTVGRLMEPKKGLVIFLAAARLLARDFPRVRFAVVGDGPAREALEARAAREGVSHRTVFAGLRRDVPDVMRALDLFVQPSKWEGFGITLLEAMAVGTPVVASRVGGVPEVVVDGETGILVPPGEPEPLAEACAALLRNRERAGRLGESGRARAVASFGIDRLVGELAALYRELYERRRGGAPGLSLSATGRET